MQQLGARSVHLPPSACQCGIFAHPPRSGPTRRANRWSGQSSRNADHLVCWRKRRHVRSPLIWRGDTACRKRPLTGKPSTVDWSGNSPRLASW